MHQRLVPTCLLLLALCSACDRHSPPAPVAASSTNVVLEVNGKLEVDLAVQEDGSFAGTAYGVSFRFEGVDVEATNSTVLGPDGTPQTNINITVNAVSGTGRGGSLMVAVANHPAELRDGSFFLGAQDFGAVREGDEVLVNPEGVHVNGERRGELPHGA